MSGINRFLLNKCFRKGSRIWDAAEWTARYVGLKIIDEGKPTDNIYVGPPWHRPGQTTWHFYEHWDLFALDRGFASDELYGAVEVFGPNGSAFSVVDSPFVTEESPTLLVEVGANHDQARHEPPGRLQSFSRSQGCNERADNRSLLL